MSIIGEVSETLLALLTEFGAADPTFQRMVSVYRDVTDVLGCRAEYEGLLRGLLATGGEGAAAHVEPGRPCAPAS